MTVQSEPREGKTDAREKQRRAIAILSLAVLVVFSAALMWFVGRPMLQFVAEPQRFRDWVDEKGPLGRLAFVGMVVLQVVVALIPGEPLELGAGYAFGPWEGAALCLVGIVIGTWLVFLLVRRFGSVLLEAFFSKEKIEGMRFLQDSRKLHLLAFVVMFIPGTPKDVLSYFMGLTQMRLGAWLLIAAVARIPSVLTSTLSGGALGGGQPLQAAIIFGATLLISAAGLLVYNRISGAKKK